MNLSFKQIELKKKKKQNDLNSKHLFSTINNRRKYNNIEELFFSPQVLFDKVKNKQFKKNMIQKKNYYTSSFIYSIPKLLSPSYDVYNNIKSSKNNTLKKKVYNIFPFQLLNKESSDLNTTRDNTKKKIIKSKIQIIFLKKRLNSIYKFIILKKINVYFL